MTDPECVEFLQWALPHLGLRWSGFRKVRRQVCRRIERRLRELDLAGVGAYRAHLEVTPTEWARLDSLCHVTNSRFYRDRAVFRFLERTVLPALARGTAERGRTLAAWSAGCASGEEAYTLALVWERALAPAFPQVRLRILATDVDDEMLRRARAAEYPESSIRDLPPAWRRDAFSETDGLFRLRCELRRPVTIRCHDVRDSPPTGPFDLALCRNLAFTYFDLQVQRSVASGLASSLRPGGALVVGLHESLPDDSVGFSRWSSHFPVYRHLSGPQGTLAVHKG